MKRIVIAGLGFGGLSAARRLSKCGFEVIMVDRHNFHLFQPLLYQVATAGLEQESIAYPIRALARRWKNSTFRLGEVKDVDFGGRRLLLEDGEISYDYLLVATGSRTNFFGMENVAKYAFDLKRLEQAEDLRNHILLRFEKASQESDPVKRAAILTFVIVGGGPTGVEFAGALRELILHVLSQDYPQVKTGESRVILVEAAPFLLAPMTPELRQYAFDKLIAMGVEVLLEKGVSDADAEHVFLGDGTVINSHTLFWSAGVAASGLADKLGLPRKSSGRIVVEPDLSVAGHPEVFVIGDMCYLEQDGKPLPMVAPVASQGGNYVANLIYARETGAEIPTPFRYHDKGSMATIGRSAAVAMAGGFSMSGFIAWIVWLLLHLYYLIGFRNRIFVMMNWAYYYFFHERQVRLITIEASKAR